MKLLMNAFEEYERKWEEELNKLPGRIETVEQALDAIERIALNGYKQIKTAEDVSLRPVSPTFGFDRTPHLLSGLCLGTSPSRSGAS